MSTIIVCGYGSGISDAVAKKFGAEGFSVALVARSASKLSEAAAALEKKGVKAKAFPTDLSDPDAVRRLIQKVRSELGAITVLHWNAYARGAEDLISASPADIRTALDVSVVGLVAAVQEALPDLKTRKDAAVLITGGGFALYQASVDAMAVQWKTMGTALGKAAQHKLVGLLAERLRGDGIYVGEVMVLGIVKGTRFDSGSATLEAATVANKFWELYQRRSEQSADVS